MAAYHAATAAVNAARTEHSAALADYERTPEGQLKLAEAVARLEADGQDGHADQIRKRMAAAAAEREQQVADLKMAQAKAERLHAALADPGTGPVLAAREAALVRAQAEHDHPDKALTEAVRTASAADPAYQAAKAEYDAARADRNAKAATVETYHAANVRPGWERRAEAARQQRRPSTPKRTPPRPSPPPATPTTRAGPAPPQERPRTPPR